jgi:hypothetical protein
MNLRRVARPHVVNPRRLSNEELAAASVDQSNEQDLVVLAGGDRNSKGYRDIALYKFVLGVAWEHQDTVSLDETNLLHKLRLRLRVDETEDRIFDAARSAFQYRYFMNPSTVAGRASRARRCAYS